VLKEFAALKLVERDVVTRKWRLTPFGTWYVSSGKVSANLKSKLVTSSPFAEVIQADSATVMKDLAANFVRVLNTGPKPPPPIVISQIRSQLEHAGEGRADAIAIIWMSEAMNLIRELSSLLAALLFFRSSLYPVNADGVARQTIPRIVSGWFNLQTPKVAERLTNYLSSLELLTAMDRAVKGGKLNQDISETSFNEIRGMLKKLGYLPR
jgi:hypothetical protein